MRIRAGLERDYAAFARLFSELALDQGVPEEARWRFDMLPGMWVAEECDEILGYAVLEAQEHAAYLAQLVAAPAARGRGIGRALTVKMAERARELGATDWSLHVDPRNLAAIALYESSGFARAGGTTSVRIDCTAIDSLAADSGVRTRALDVDETDRIEKLLDFEPGSVVREITKLGRRGFVAYAGTEILGATVFAPALVSAYPFRVRRAGATAPLLRALRADATADRTLLIGLADDPETVEQLLTAGGSVRLETLLYRAPL